jgi:hypothetical protein
VAKSGYSSNTIDMTAQDEIETVNKKITIEKEKTN